MGRPLAGRPEGLSAVTEFAASELVTSASAEPRPHQTAPAASEPVRLAVFGAGSRGRAYGDWVLRHPDRATVVAVAEASEDRRTAYAAAHGVSDEARFADWGELLAARSQADAVLICLPDRQHVEPAVAALAAGYHVLLEKPMAPTAAESRVVAAAAQASGRIFGVCHVLRFTPYTALVRRLIAEDAVGRVLSIEHTEPVGWWHHAHSYVRGSWAQTAASGPMLLTKSCHDLDWLQYVVGDRIARVSSFGRTSHFTPENAPPGASERCLDCALASSCAYSATRIYLDTFSDGEPLTWPHDVLTATPTRAALRDALATGPYGRCVYLGDNDVVDHQVVAMEFAGGATGTFTMTAFSPREDRKTRVYGTSGFLDGDGSQVRHVDFRTGSDTVHSSVESGAMDVAGGHSGGDDGVMEAFVAAVASGDQSRFPADAAESLSSHLAVFAAEDARLSGTVRVVESPPVGLTG